MYTEKASWKLVIIGSGIDNCGPKYMCITRGGPSGFLSWVLNSSEVSLNAFSPFEDDLHIFCDRKAYLRDV